MSIRGLTIDYGPYGWIDNFDPDWTPNTTDAGGRRYCFGRQPHIAYWNLERFGSAIASAFDSTAPLEGGLARYVQEFNGLSRDHASAKFGLVAWIDGDDALVNEGYRLLQAAEMDMTLFFRQLADIDVNAPSLDVLQPAFYDETKRAAEEDALQRWLEQYAARIRRDGRPAMERRAQMNAVNPRYVLRNYLAQQAIDLAEQGDPSRITELLDVMRHPYDDQPGREQFAERRPEWARHRAGCSMLSCSS
jgi:protein adenylyltransferase